MARLLGCVSVLLVAIVPSARGDWNQFRGPTGQGIAEGKDLPIEFGPEKNLAWKTAIPGLGWSSPVIVGGKVFLTTAVPKSDAPEADHSLRAFCLDATSGSILWDVEVFKQTIADVPRIHKKNSHASPTPFVDGNRVFVHFSRMGTACLDAATGKILWTQQGLRYEHRHGGGGSPILYKDLLIYSTDGIDVQKVVALDAATGKVRWETPRNANPKSAFSFSTPIIITVAGKDQVISAGSETVMALDPLTGREIWRVLYPGGYSLVPRPVFAHGLVYVCTGYNTPSLYAIKPEGTGDLTNTNVVWKTKTNAPHNPSVLIVDKDLYMVSDKGILSCLDAKTGKERWNERVGGGFSASPMFVDGNVYILDEEGTVTVFPAGTSYDPVATNKLGERALASPAVDSNSLYIRTAKHVYKFVKS